MLYKCPFCVIVSNRRYNIKRHIFRKHPGKEIPQTLPSLFKSAALYSCPYCKTTSNRKYNMKEHINRKHHGAEIPENLGSTSKNFTHPSVLPEIPSSIYPTWPIYSNDINIPPHCKQYGILLILEKKPVINHILEYFWNLMSITIQFKNKINHRFHIFTKIKILLNSIKMCILSISPILILENHFYLRSTNVPNVL